jgi:hypothetical protein
MVIGCCRFHNRRRWPQYGTQFSDNCRRLEACHTHRKFLFLTAGVRITLAVSMICGLNQFAIDSGHTVEAVHIDSERASTEIAFRTELLTLASSTCCYYCYCYCYCCGVVDIQVSIHRKHHSTSEYEYQH